MVDQQAHGFVGEYYWPDVSEQAMRVVDERIAACAEALNVRYLGSILLQGDEVVLCQFEGTADAVRQVRRVRGSRVRADPRKHDVPSTRGNHTMIRRSKTPAVAAAIAVLVVLAAEAGESDASPNGTFKRIATVNATTAAAVAIARTANGALHLVYQTFSGRAFSGLASLPISAAGNAGAEVQALSAGRPGSRGARVVDGTLESFFGATRRASSRASGHDVERRRRDVVGSPPTSAAAARTKRSRTARRHRRDGRDDARARAPAGREPRGPDRSRRRLAEPRRHEYRQRVDDGRRFRGRRGDAARSSRAGLERDNPSLYLQGVAPTVEAPQVAPGQNRNALVLAGRDKRPGRLAAYTTDGKHVRLFRYGGGSVAVGLRAGTTAKVLGVATGLDGRIWVMWGDDAGGGVAVTRSNKAVTRSRRSSTSTRMPAASTGSRATAGSGRSTCSSTRSRTGQARCNPRGSTTRASCRCSRPPSP